MCLVLQVQGEAMLECFTARRVSFHLVDGYIGIFLTRQTVDVVRVASIIVACNVEIVTCLDSEASIDAQ